MLKIITAVLLAAGAGMFIYSLHLPYYNNEKAKEELDNKIELQDVHHQEYKNNYYKSVAKLKTSKNALDDTGSGLVVFSLPLLVLFFIRNINSFGDLKKIGGLNKMPLNVIAFIMWLLLLPGTWWYYGHKAGRGDYPWFADSIGIPIMQNTAAIIITFLLLLIILPLLTRQYRSASSVFIRAKLYNAGAMLTEVFYGLFLTISVLALYDCIVNGDHISIIVIMYFIYLFLALRAGRFTYMDNVSH